MSYPPFTRQSSLAGVSVRRLGVQTADELERAMHDPGTVFCRPPHSDLPALCPIRLISGYDADRTSSLTGDPEPLLLLVRPEWLPADVRDQLIGRAVVVESSDEAWNGIGSLADQLGGVVRSFSATSGVHARMSLYSLSARPPEVRPASPEDATERMLTNSDAVEFVPGEVVLSRPGLFDVFWSLLSQRFSSLGEEHPVALEESPEFARQMLSLPGQVVGLAWVEDRLAALAWLSVGLRMWPWLDSRLSEELEEGAWAAGQLPLYTVALAADLQDEGVAARNLLLHWGAQAVRTATQQLVTFESTEVSSRYVPKLISRYLGSAPGVQILRPPTVVGSVTYSWVDTRPDATLSRAE